MSHTKHTSKRKRARKAVPMLGVAGVSLALAGSASAGTSGPAADIASRDTAPRHEITLGEEEISDSAWRRSMSSTRRTPEHRKSAKNLPGGEAAEAVAGEAAAGEAAGVVAARDAIGVSSCRFDEPVASIERRIRAEAIQLVTCRECSPYAVLRLQR